MTHLFLFKKKGQIAKMPFVVCIVLYYLPRHHCKIPSQGTVVDSVTMLVTAFFHHLIFKTGSARVPHAHGRFTHRITLPIRSVFTCLQSKDRLTALAPNCCSSHLYETLPSLDPGYFDACHSTPSAEETAMTVLIALSA